MLSLFYVGKFITVFDQMMWKFLKFETEKTLQ
jgi:hypothetical protein